MTLLSSQMIKRYDKKISRSQLNEVIRQSKQQRLTPQVETDEVQVKPQADQNGGNIRFESIPVLYKTVDHGVDSSSVSDDDPNVYARKVNADGTLSGSTYEFVKLESA